MELDRERIRKICIKKNISGASAAVIENGKVRQIEAVTAKTEDHSFQSNHCL